MVGEGLGDEVECGIVFSSGDVEWEIAFNEGLAEDAVSDQDEQKEDHVHVWTIFSQD